PQKKQPRRKQRKDTKVPQPSGSTEPITDEAANEEHVPIHSNDQLLSGEDILKLNELMELYTNLSQRVLDLENIKTSQAAEITKLKERVNKLERRNKSRTLGLKRLRKVGRSAQVVSSEDEGLGAQEDASKQGRKIEVETLIEIKAAKPKAVTTATTTTTNAVTRPKARGVVVQEPTQLNVKLEKEEKLTKQREKDANIAECDNVQDMIDADYELAARLQAQEQEELTVEEKSKLLKDKGSVTRAKESSSKRASTLLEQERIKKKKIDDDQEEAEMKTHMEIVVDEEEIAVDAIPLATKPPINVDWKKIKEGKMGNFQIIKADGSSRR
ncbi:hypothetical protein Tco_1454243, partial [Tanacetum coccineum]